MTELAGGRTVTAGPRLEPVTLDKAGAFPRAPGLVIGEVCGVRVTAHLDFGRDTRRGESCTVASTRPR